MRQPGTRRFITPTATVTLDRSLDDALIELVRSVAGEVLAVVEATAEDIVSDTRAKWYTMVRKRSGRSGAGTKYRLEVRGDEIRAIIYNDAKAIAKQDVNIDAQGRLLPGTNKKAGEYRSAEELYAYFVKRPTAVSTVAIGLPLQEYRQMMSYYRKYNSLPFGYVAAAMEDRLGRKRPVGLARIVRNPLASDGKELWNSLVVKGTPSAIKRRAMDLDRALQAAGRRFGR